MATSTGLKLNILLPTKHRITVKIASKETLLREVLEDACKKRKLDPDRHRLKRNNKVSSKMFSLHTAWNADSISDNDILLLINIIFLYSS